MSASNQLQRQIGLKTATALVAGDVIAVGIFLTPAGMAKSLGSPFWLLIVWLLSGAMALCGALCYGELAAKYPQAGGGYVYLREAYGRATAFLYGWMALFVMDPGLTAALAVGAATYTSYIFQLSPAAIKLLSIAVIVVIAGANFFGIRIGARVLNYLTVLKLAVLVFLVIWGFALQLGDWSNFVPFTAQRPGSAPLMVALAGSFVAGFFSFGGWWDVTKLAAEVKEPERTLPLALIYGVLIVTLVYVLTSAVFIYLVSLSSVSSPETFAAQAGEVLFGRVGGTIFSAVVITAVLGSLAAIIMSAPRVYFAMARDGLFPAPVATIHPKFGTPTRAITIQVLIASILVLFGNFNEIISYFVFIVVIFIGLTVASLFVVRRRAGYTSKYRTPGYPLTPLIFLALVALLLFLLGSANPKQAAVGLLVVLLGLPFYFLFFRRPKS